MQTKNLYTGFVDGQLLQVDCQVDDLNGNMIKSVHGLNNTTQDATVSLAYDAQNTTQLLSAGTERTVNLPNNRFFWPIKGGPAHEISIIVEFV